MAIWNYAQKAIKDCLPFDPAIPLLGLYPKEIIGKTTCTKIFIASFFQNFSKKLENKRIPSIGEWLNNCGICWWWNTIVLKGIVNWSNSMWTGMTSRNWCKVKGAEPGEQCTQRLIHCGTIKRNGLLYLLSKDPEQCWGTYEKESYPQSEEELWELKKQLIELMCWWGY